MAKLVLTKDPSHSGYYLDGEGNLYVFRFGGRPIKVDEYREDKPRENVKNDKVEIDSEKIINHKKSASLSENNKFIEEVEKEKEKNKKEIDSFIKKSKDPYGGKNLETLNEMKTLQRGLNDELSNTEHRNEDLRRLEIGKELAKESDPSLRNASEELLEREGRRWLQYNDGEILEGEPYKNYKGELEVPTEYLHNRLNNFKETGAKNIIKEKTGQREMYQSIAKLMNDNEDKLSSEEWKALDNARMILKQNPELIADESPLLDESKPLHERLSKYMNDNEYKLDSGVWGPLYEANQELRKHDSGQITKLKDRYEKSQGVSDDWFTEEGRKLGMKDEDIADAIYTKKGAEAQGSSDANIKRIIAGKEKDKWEKLLKDYEEKIANPNTGDWDREFAKSELQGIKNKIEQYADYEAKFIRKVNRDDEPFIVKYRDTDSGFVENFKAKGLDEAFQLQEQWRKYSPDVHIYDINGEEITYDKDRKHYTSPTYEENKKKELRSNFRSRLYGADRASLISMVHRLGLKWNVENFTDQQLYRMLQKELEK